MMRTIGTMGLALLLPACAWAQDVKLQVRQAALGERMRVRIDSTLDLDIAAKDKDSEGERTSQLTQIVTEVFRQEIVAVENGTAWTTKVQCEIAELQRSSTNSPLQKVSTELQGKEFVVRRAVGSKAVVEMADRSPLLPAAGRVGGWDDLSLLLPGRDVKVGDQWVIEKDVASLWSMANMVETDSTPQIVAVLKGVEAGKATITFTGSISGRARDGGRVKASITEAALVFDVDAGRIVSMQLAGELDLQRNVIRVYTNPTTAGREPESVGEIRAKSRKLEVKIAFE